MAKLRTNPQLKQAQAVLAIIEAILEEDSPDLVDIHVRYFRNYHDIGLELSICDSSRKCNLFACPDDESFVVKTGALMDFWAKSGTSKDSAEKHSFGSNEHRAVAEFVVGWLCNGIK